MKSGIAAAANCGERHEAGLPLSSLDAGFFSTTVIQIA